MDIALELANQRRLAEPRKVDAGPYMLNIRFPSGQLMAQRVEVGQSEGEPSVSFFVVKKAPKSKPTPPDEKVGRIVSQNRVIEYLAPFDAAPASRERWAPRPVEAQASKSLALRDIPALIPESVVEPRQRNYGVARLQSSPAPEAFRERTSSPTRQVDPLAVVGELQSLQPIKLYGTSEALHTKWKAPLRSEQLMGSKRDEGKFHRYFALSYQGGEAVRPKQVACVPGRWKVADGGAGEISVTYQYNRLGHVGEPRMRLSIDDPTFGQMLEYMQTGDLKSSNVLLEEAKLKLRDKVENPYAAAAGAYVLLSSGMRDEALRWGEWIYNLAHGFHTLPDGMVLYSTLLLQGPSERWPWLVTLKGEVDERALLREALRAIIESLKRGPPLYRLGLSFLTSNLQILASELVDDHGMRGQVTEAERFVRHLSLRVDPLQPFSVFDVEDVDG
jgi:hypothetical protein